MNVRVGRVNSAFKVYVAGRSEERVSSAVAKLESKGIKSGSVHALKLDLADPILVKQSAEDFLSKESRLDILGEARLHSVDGHAEQNT